MAVCSGLHVEPNTPDIRGINSVPLAIHSSNFKSRKQLEDKTVLVLGSGETGADIAYLAATSRTKRVVMCHRDGFHFAPKVGNLARSTAKADGSLEESRTGGTAATWKKARSRRARYTNRCQSRKPL